MDIIPPLPKNLPSKIRPQLHPKDFGPHWNTVYYEIVQEIYWDPKMIGRIPANPPVFANDKEMLGNLRRTEVPLNHLLSLFFSLVPHDYVSRLESHIFGNSSVAPYRNVGIFELRRELPHDPTQPDVFLCSETNFLSIEVKVGAKSSLEQVVKYGLMHLCAEKRDGAKPISRLVYFTPRPIQNTWQEKFSGVEEMKAAVKNYDFAGLIKKSRVSSAVSSEELEIALTRLEVAHLTFDEFEKFTRAYANCISADSPYSDMPRKLFEGILNELTSRHEILNIKSTTVGS